VITIPTPAGPTVFHLNPIDTVRDFVADFHEECNSKVSFATQDGTKIANNTVLRHVFASPFQLHVGQKVFLVNPAPTSPEDSATGTLTAGDASITMSTLQEYLRRHDERQQAIQSIQSRLNELHNELAPLEDIRAKIEDKARASTKRWGWFGIAAMGLQFGVLARLTWWEYSWDLMEPVTYFVTYGASIGMYLYYVMSHREYNYEVVADRHNIRKFFRLAPKHKFDVEKYSTIKAAIAKAEQDLTDIRHS